MRRAVAMFVLAVTLAVAASARAQQDVPSGAGRVAPDNVFQHPWHPKGYVMLIHGGSFLFVGEKRYLETSQAAWFRRQGWGTYDIDYGAGIASIRDVVAAYHHLRTMVGSRPAICVQGTSAGGTLALLLAAEQASVSCVITEGAIFTFNALTLAYRAGLAWILSNQLWQFSPARVASRIRAFVLMGGSTRDTVVPEAAQLRDAKSERPQTDTMLLPGARWPGGYSVNFAHASVTRTALRRFQQAEVRLLARAAGHGTVSRLRSPPTSS